MEQDDKLSERRRSCVFVVLVFLLIFGCVSVVVGPGRSLVMGFLWGVYTPTPTSPPGVTPTPPPEPLAYVVVNSNTEPDGTIKNIASLSIGPIGIGQLLFTYPATMNLGDSAVIRLSITPDSAVADLISVSMPTQNADLLPAPIQITDTTDIYPVMKAVLFGSGFEITSDDQSQKTILSDRPTEWLWIIRPEEEGVLSISATVIVPARIDGIDGLLGTELKNIPANIIVKKSLQRRIDDMTPYVIPALIALAGVIIGVYANNQVKKRKVKAKGK